MNTQYSNWKNHLILVFCLCAAVQLYGQQPGFRPPQPGSGGGGGTQRGGGTGSASRQYNSNGTVGDAIISVDPETKSIIIITDDETNQYVSQVIKELDRPKPQVLIKVVFLEVTYNNNSDIGIEASLNKRVNDGSTVNLADQFGLAAAGLGGTVAGAPVGQGLYQILFNDYQVTLRAIANAGKTEVLSRPSILARNNQPATIVVGQSVPLITSVRFDTFGNAINSVTYQDVGVILQVTPFITSEGLVEMILSPQISSISPTDKVAISNGVTAPIIDKRSADTVVVTPEGQPVIIGGLMKNQKTETDNKIPLLGDIPVVGNLFKQKIKGDIKTELLIFLTPHIVKMPSQLAAFSEDEKNAAELHKKAFTEEELNKFLDGLPVKKLDSQDNEDTPGESNSDDGEGGEK